MSELAQELGLLFYSLEEALTMPSTCHILDFTYWRT